MTPGKTILVVDDEEGVRAVLVDCLTMLGYDVEAAASGEEALSAFDETRHGLLITDHRMSGMSGAELIRLLRRQTPSLPVVALTGAGAEAERQLRDAGADEILRKPFGIGQIRDAVERVLRGDGRS